ncbi:MAG: hypothetical protein JRF33_14530 [Deltaproteobacteria bacterium]|nr:hypothetical protein [Deltaproteobacteria bacterium]
MRRIHNTLTITLAFMATAGMLNWVSTCCCGRSLILEAMEGGCASETHGHEGGLADCDHHHGHVAHHLPGQHDSGCHKRGAEQFLGEQDGWDDSLACSAPILLPIPVFLAPGPMGSAGEGRASQVDDVRRDKAQALGRLEAVRLLI